MADLLGEHDLVYRRVNTKNPDHWDHEVSAPVAQAFGLRKLDKSEWGDIADGKARKYERGLSVDDASLTTPERSLICASDDFVVVGLRVLDLLALKFTVPRKQLQAYTNGQGRNCPANPAHCLVIDHEKLRLYDLEGKETLLRVAHEVDQATGRFIRPFFPRDAA